jgi:hypoxanthine-guanine phosphoribosyltransferase
MLFLQALPLNVDLDIAQVSSVTRQPPSKAMAVVNKLKSAHKVVVLDDVLDIGRARYKRIAL